MKDKALKLALDALEKKAGSWGVGQEILNNAAITSIREALSQPAQEPVAFGMFREDGLILDVICPDEHESFAGEYTVPLYIAPPAAKPAQEPVAHCKVRPLRGDESSPQVYIEWVNGQPISGALYITPPKRPWVDLTDEQIAEVAEQGYQRWKEFARAILAKSKELNT